MGRGKPSGVRRESQEKAGLERAEGHWKKFFYNSIVQAVVVVVVVVFVFIVVVCSPPLAPFWAFSLLW